MPTNRQRKNNWIVHYRTAVIIVAASLANAVAGLFGAGAALSFFLGCGAGLAANFIAKRFRGLTTPTPNTFDIFLKETQGEANKHNALYRLAAQSASLGGWVYDNVGARYIMTPELRSLFGMPSEFADELPIASLITSDCKKKFDRAVAVCLEKGPPFDVKVSLHTSREGTIWLHVRGQAERTDGQIIFTQGSVQDITENHIAEHALRLQDFALNQAPDSILTINAFGRILSANETTYSRFGYDEGELVGRNIEIINPDLSKEDWKRWWHKHKNYPHLVTHTRNTTKTGEKFNVEISSGYFIYNSEELCVMTIKDITERKQQDEAIQHLAYHDMLTGLPNRGLMQDRLLQAMVAAKRHNYVGALLFIDLDNFKQINDSLGHAAGDQVLQELAERLKTHLRTEDTVARLGGDEFVVILPHLSDNEDEALSRSEDLARKLLSVSSRPFIISEQSLLITVSIGLVLFPGGYDSAEDLLQYADTAMYKAKSKGRDTIAIFNPKMIEETNRRLTLEQKLDGALGRGEYVIHYQLQHNSDGSIRGAETLLRWKPEASPLVLPSDFIPALESNDLITEVGDWVLHSACEQIRTWIDKGLWDPKHSLSVNISPGQFDHDYFATRLEEVLRQYKVPPSCLELELAEEILLYNVGRVASKIEELKDVGVRVAVDDFGTSYSSLAYLKHIRLDTLKIDQALVAEVVDDADVKAIVSTLITMAKQLNIRLIAEGVETLEQFKLLKQLECSAFQGFYFSEPMAAREIEYLLEGSLFTQQKLSNLN